ncbi:unnamed protein product [Cylindrotheca closterium]|uniref:AB hydrolase-1 domain-containing protein n=1 Tax=Cylindrotheca closterium TaxID=2856 RepID=A0AAD2CFG5_9STRA|nr:unnamed protein product [Cylindrotheca closterium]
MRSPFRSLLTSALTTYTGGGGGGGGSAHSKRCLSSLVSLQEISIPAADGTIMAAQRWTKQQPRQTPATTSKTTTDSENDEKSSESSSQKFDRRTILCTHGWLDNCGTHHYLAPRLALELEDGAEIIALDFPGHGHSSHRSKDAPPLVSADLVYYTCEAIRALQSPSFSFQASEEEEEKVNQPEDFPEKWTTDSASGSIVDTTSDNEKKKITIVGHSLGAAVASLTAASFPEWIDQLVLLDAATFLPRQATDTAEHVRQHILKRQQHTNSQDQQQQPPRVYPNLERAIQVRQFSATKMPGNQAMSHQAARAMVMRGTRKVVDSQQMEEEKKDEVETLDSMDDTGPVQFRHDPRFTWPSIQYMTWEQNEGIMAALHKTDIDVCLLQAESGWPVDDYITKRVKEILQPTFFRRLPGKHHFHADPETAEAVGDAVIEFLKR